MKVNDSTVSDLSINFNSTSKEGEWGGVCVRNGVVQLANLDIKIQASENATNVRSGIYVFQNGQTNISGNIFIQTSGQDASGIFTNGTTNILSGSEINLDINSSRTSYGLYVCRNGTTNIMEGATVNIANSGNYSINIWENSTLNIYGICNFANRGVNLGTTNNTINIFSSARLNYYSNATGYLNVTGSSIINFDKGATLTDRVQQKSFQLKEDIHGKQNLRINLSTIETELKTIGTQQEDNPPFYKKEIEIRAKLTNPQYGSILSQYDQLIKDASYKDINLLQNERLGVNFNETRSASLNVQGKDMSSAALGLTTID